MQSNGATRLRDSAIAQNGDPNIVSYRTTGMNNQSLSGGTTGGVFFGAAGAAGTTVGGGVVMTAALVAAVPAFVALLRSGIGCGLAA
jgi:hypothetical protein